MAKSSGLGDALFIDGIDLSGDIGALGAVGGGPAPLDVTGLRSLGFERIGGRRDGRIEYSGFFNAAVGAAHPTLSALPEADRSVIYCRGEAVGNAAACLIGKVADYPVTRANDGALTVAGAALGSGYGLEWGEQLTAGVHVDTAGADGATLDGLAATAFGAQFYLHVLALTGTNVVLTVQDSANGTAWANLAGAAFTSATTAPQAQRIATARTATVRRYLRVVSSGVFTSASFAVVAVRNAVLTEF